MTATATPLPQPSSRSRSSGSIASKSTAWRMRSGASTRTVRIDPTHVAKLIERTYVDDVDEAVGYAYRYWELRLEVDGREYGVRIYTDEPGKASVPIAPRPVDDEQHADLRALARYLAENEDARLHVIGDSGGYEELEAAIARKRSRA